MSERLPGAVVARAREIVAAAALLAVLALATLFGWSNLHFGLTVDPSLRALLPRNGSETATFDAISERYTTDDLLFVAWVDRQLFTPLHLARLKAFTQSVEDIPGVEHVESLATALRTEIHDDYSEVHAFLNEPPSTTEQALAIRDAALGNPLYAGYLVSRDGQGTMISVRFERDLPARRQIAIAGEIAAASRAAAGDIEQFLSGPLYVRLEMSRLLLNDLLHVMPLAVAVTLLVAAVGYRNTRGVIFPLLANGLAVAATLAVFHHYGHALSYVTVILPPTIYVTGFAYAIHVVSDFDRHVAAGLTAAAAARAALADVRAPVTFAALTTVIGFASLTTSDIESIRLFGTYAALGTALSWLAAMSLVPACLVLWPLRYRPRQSMSSTGRVAPALARFARQRTRAIIVGGLLLTGLSTAGALRIDVGTDYLSNFDEQSAVRRQFERLNTLFAGAVPLQVVIESDAIDAFKSTHALRAVADLERWLLEQPEIGGVYSVLDYLAVIERTLTPEDIDSDPVPASTSLTSHLLLLGSGEDIHRFADSSFRSTLLQVRARVVASADLNALSDRIEERLRSLPPDLRGYVTGSSYLIARTLDDVTRGQLLSAVASLLPIYAVLAWMLRSFRIAAIALIPNVLPILVFFGILGWSGITLNLTTSLVASLVFGIAVDDTIHLLLRLRTASRRVADAEHALMTTLDEVLHPVTFTSAGLALGFLTLAGGELSSQADFGALAAATIAIAWVLEVAFTPALGLHIIELDRARRAGIPPAGQS